MYYSHCNYNHSILISLQQQYRHHYTCIYNMIIIVTPLGIFPKEWGHAVHSIRSASARWFAVHNSPFQSRRRLFGRRRRSAARWPRSFTFCSKEVGGSQTALDSAGRPCRVGWNMGVERPCVVMDKNWAHMEETSRTTTFYIQLRWIVLSLF